MTQQNTIIDEITKEKTQVFIDKLELPTFHRNHVIMISISDKNMKNKTLAKVPIPINTLKIFSQLSQKMQIEMQNEKERLQKISKNSLN